MPNPYWMFITPYVATACALGATAISGGIGIYAGLHTPSQTSLVMACTSFGTAVLLSIVVTLRHRPNKRYTTDKYWLIWMLEIGFAGGLRLGCALK